MARLYQIVSGGQSGVDRAALDLAVRLGIDYSGWCPRGGWAEDYPDPPGLIKDYPELQPTPQTDPSQRSRWNVKDSDGLLVLTVGEMIDPGSQEALAEAEYLARPWLVVNIDRDGARERAEEFIGQLPPLAKLNIAGPRASQADGIYQRAYHFLLELLS